jgi:ABC transport system ATP-binding/permease protein
MSEEILKALMQLFALVSSPNQNEENRRNVVRNYLSLQLNSQRVDEYLSLFDLYIQEQEIKLRETSKLKKRYAASSVKVLRIATSINEELTHYQKLVVIIQLLEFLNSGSRGISAIEIEFANTIADTFNINNDEYLEIYAFITDNFKNQSPGNNLLIISGNKEHKQRKGYLYREHLQNELRILNIHSGNVMLLKSKKASDLTINGQIIQPGRIHFMRPGSSLRHRRSTPITYTTISSQFYNSQQKETIYFQAKDISFNYAKSAVGLRQMNFTSGSGSLVGIMGDSGAGKTTLINLLTGILKPKSGSVTINGEDIHSNPLKVKGLIGYVSQDDLLIEDLTVYQNLYYNATLCFDHISKSNIKRKVISLLKALGLYEIKDMKVGNPLNKKISGGQRKRLNIALELIREPAVMFLDEPTSGLSSRDSENIMDLLKELALKGKLIFVVIHQPSSDIFKMFDQLLVLDTGGYLIYDGDAVEAINYFKNCVNYINREESECAVCGNVSPEQILTIVGSNMLDEYGNPTGERRISAREWYQMYQTYHQSPNPESVEKKLLQNQLPEVNFKIPGKLKQAFIFIKRDVHAKLSNAQYLIINLLESPMLAFILASLILYFEIGAGNSNGYIFSQNPNLTVYIIISVIIAIFIGLSVSAEEIINDRKILKRESFLNLSRLSYLSSKFILLSIISAVQTALFVLVGNSIMKIHGMGWHYWLILFSSSVFANLLGLNISDSFKKTVNIYILIPFLIIPQLILSGVFINFDQLNPKLSSDKGIPWYGELIVARWAFEAIAVEQFINNAYQKEFYTYERIKSQATYIKDYWIPEMNNQIQKRELSSNQSEKKRIDNLVFNELVKYQKFASSEIPNELKWDAETFKNQNANEIQDYLKSLRTFYIKLYNKADEAIEAHKREIIARKGEAYLIELKESHYNENMERFVRRNNDLFIDRLLVLEDELVQKIDPIFRIPDHPLIKAHFLAPFKNVGPKTFSTYSINLAIIWLFNTILFVLLYISALKKALNARYRIKKTG